MSVVGRGKYDDDCLNRQLGDTLFLSGLVRLETMPPTAHGTVWRLSPQLSRSSPPWCAGWGNVTR